MNVRADLVDWRHGAYLRSAKSVASCAVLAVNRFPLGGQILLNGERVLGGWKQSQPVLNPFESREINAGGVTPAPNAALLFRSCTTVLLPSQWSCMPSRGSWFQIEGKSAAPISSSGGSLSMGKLNLSAL